MARVRAAVHRAVAAHDRGAVVERVQATRTARQRPGGVHVDRGEVSAASEAVEPVLGRRRIQPGEVQRRETRAALNVYLNDARPETLAQPETPVSAVSP